MKAITILKSLSISKCTDYYIDRITRMNDYEVHCGELEDGGWYVLCNRPQLGKADACGQMRSDRKPFYAYKIDDFE